MVAAEGRRLSVRAPAGLQDSAMVLQNDEFIHFPSRVGIIVGAV